MNYLPRFSVFLSGACLFVLGWLIRRFTSPPWYSFGSMPNVAWHAISFSHIICVVWLPMRSSSPGGLG